MIDIKAHVNNIALHHTIFDLPFAFMAAILASNGSPDLWTLFLIAVAVTSGRAAALAIDNLADLKYDKKQPRMSYPFSNALSKKRRKPPSYGDISRNKVSA